MIKLLAIDMDGTLLNSFSKLSKVNLSALYRAKEAGIEIVPTTGRTLSCLPHTLQEHSDLFRYVITSNGASLYDTKYKRELFSSSIPRYLVHELVFALKKEPVFISAHIDHEYWVDGALMRLNGRLVFGKDAFQTKASKDLFEQLLNTKGSVEEIQLYFLGKKTKARIQTILQSFPEVYGAFTSNYVEIFSRSSSKGKALDRLREHLNLDQSEIACIGDGENDVLMFEQAGLAICMKNGEEKIQEKADKTTLSNNQNGVAYAIDQYILTE